MKVITMNTGTWTEDEHQRFLEGIEKYGKDWEKVATMIPTRTICQVRTHAQKYYSKLEKDRKKAELYGLNNPSARDQPMQLRGNRVDYARLNGENSDFDEDSYPTSSRKHHHKHKAKNTDPIVIKHPIPAHIAPSQAQVPTLSVGMYAYGGRDGVYPQIANNGVIPPYSYPPAMNMAVSPQGITQPMGLSIVGHPGHPGMDMARVVPTAIPPTRYIPPMQQPSSELPPGLYPPANFVLHPAYTPRGVQQTYMPTPIPATAPPSLSQEFGMRIPPASLPLGMSPSVEAANIAITTKIEPADAVKTTHVNDVNAMNAMNTTNDINTTNTKTKSFPKSVQQGPQQQTSPGGQIGSPGIVYKTQSPSGTTATMTTTATTIATTTTTPSPSIPSPASTTGNSSACIPATLPSAIPLGSTSLSAQLSMHAPKTATSATSTPSIASTSIASTAAVSAASAVPSAIPPAVVATARTFPMYSMNDMHAMQAMHPMHSVQSLPSMQSIQSIQPVQPMQSIQPVQPMQSMQSMQSMQPVQPVQMMRAATLPPTQMLPNSNGAVQYHSAPYPPVYHGNM